MAEHREKVLQFYAEFEEDARATLSRAAGLEFHYTKKLLDDYIMPSSDVIELGCATGYYGFYFADRCARYTGVDLSPENIDVFEKKIAAAGKANLRASVGDATDLSGFQDESFDAVLCLGPMYHLPETAREKVFDECRRIAKKGAVLAFAYINRLGAYIGACIDPKWAGAYPNENANRAVFENNTDDVLPDLFFFTSPEEMEAAARRKNLTVLKNRGVNFEFAAHRVDQLSEEQFLAYRALVDKMSDSLSCVGLAANSLLICQK